MLPNMSAIAAQQLGVRCTKGTPMSDDHQLHLTLVNIDQRRSAPLCVQQKHDGEDCHLKLWAGPHEGAANRLQSAMPAELEV